MLKIRSVGSLSVLLLSSLLGCVRPATGDVRVDDLWCPAEQAEGRIADLRTAVEASPQDADAKVQLAWLLHRYHNATDDAARLAREVLAARPDDYRAHELAGVAAVLRGDLDAAFDHWIRLLDQEHPENERYIEVLPDLVQDAGRRDRLYARLQQLADDSAANPWLAARATWLLANRLVDLGRFDEAKARFESLRPIADWMIVGPFSNERNSGFSRVFGPETEIDYAGSYEGRGRQITWRRLEPLDVTGSASLDDLLYPDEDVLAYAVTFVHVPQEVNALARFGLSSSGRLWVNDQLLWSNDQPTNFAFDQYAASVTLAAGWNKVLLKVCEFDRGWSYLFRLTGADGRPIPDLTATFEPHDTPDRSAAERPAFDCVKPMLQHFQDLADREPNNEAALYYLARALATSQLRTRRADALETLVGINPTCGEYRLHLGRAYLADDKPEKALEQIKRAIDLDPGDVQARVLLGRFYVSRGLDDRARQVLNAVLAERPDFALARRALQRAYEAEAWSENAFREAERLYERFPDMPWALANYAQWCEARDYTDRAQELYERALREESTNWTVRMALVDLALAQERRDDALKLLTEAQPLKPANNSLRLQRVTVLLAQRKYDQAIALCREALAINEADYRVHRQLGEVYQRLGQDEQALACYRDALRYEPDDRWLRKYVEFLAPVENPAFARFGVSADEAADIVKRRVAPEDYPRVGAVVLLDHRVTQLFEDGSSTSLEHRIVQILNETGRRAYTRVPALGASMEVKRAVVITADGREVEATKVSPTAIQFDQLQPGSIIEYKVVYREGSNEWMGRHYAGAFAFQDAVPVRRSQWVLLVPASRELRYVVQGDLVELTQSEFQGHNVYDFAARDVPQLEPESFRPPAADIIQSVHVSTIESWEEIARWEYALIKDQFAPDADVKAKAHELTADCRMRDEKIRALAHYVAEDIEYELLHGGIFGIKPHKAANVLQNQWGDCKDKATLLIAMLREVGVEACYATLRTRDTGRLITELPSNQCNHAIVYVPAPDGSEAGWWIDGTAQYYGADTLPWRDQGVEAFVFDRDGQVTFRQTPVQPPEANASDYSVSATLAPDGAADAAVQWQSTGQFAAALRSIFRQPGKREEQLAAVANQIRPGSRLGEYAFSDLDERSTPVDISFEFQSPQFARVVGSQMIIKPLRELNMTATYAANPVRYHDYFLHYLNALRLAESYVVPEGYEVESMPEPAHLDTPWMSYDARCVQTGDTVAITKTLTTKVLTIPRERYEEFQTFCQEVDRHDRRTIILRQTAKEPSPLSATEPSAGDDR